MSASSASPGNGPREPMARFGGMIAEGLVEVSHDVACLDDGGRWAVLVTYEGHLTCARFRTWRQGAAADAAGAWTGPAADAWTSSLDSVSYRAAVERVREHIGRGDVYQANVCRTLQATLPEPERGDVGGLHALLVQQNPAPYEGVLRLPGIQVATASPELFLARSGTRVRTGPIKGTARSEADLLPKDVAENVMIVDLMRNDLARVCEPGSVEVPHLLRKEKHPGLVHLVSDVTGELTPGCTWRDIFDATLPPAQSAGHRRPAQWPSCGSWSPNRVVPTAVSCGWIDADTGEAVLAVAIRTFWIGEDSVLRFGTGAGITWGSQADREWDETELKARHLVATAGGSWR